MGRGTHLRFDDEGVPIPLPTAAEPEAGPEPEPEAEAESERPPWKGIFNRRGKVRPPYNPALETFWFRRRELFSKYDKGVRLDAESWFSVTPELLARHTAVRLIRGAGGRGLLVVDPFCGCGGNAIQQALHDPTGEVLAIDIDPCKVAMARHNAYLYGVRERIHFVVGDAMELLPRLRADAVFLSPPWGGIEYEEDGAFDLSRHMLPCCGMRIFDAACAAAPAVAYYLPKSTDRAQLAALAKRHRSGSCELQHIVRRSIAKGEKSKGLIAFFDAMSPLGVPPGVTEVTVDDPSATAVA